MIISLLYASDVDRRWVRIQGNMKFEQLKEDLRVGRFLGILGRGKIYITSQLKVAPNKLVKIKMTHPFHWLVLDKPFQGNCAFLKAIHP